MIKNWQYHTLKIISWLVSLLPYRIILYGGKMLGRLYFHLAGRQRRRALAQMTAGLGISPAAAGKIVRSLFEKLGQTFMEVMYMPVLRPDNINRFVRIENGHYLAEAVAGGRGVVLLTAHIGNWEWLGASLAMNKFPLTSLIKRQPNEQYTRILNEYRQMVGIEIFARGTAELVGAARALKQGKILGFLADQDAGASGIFVKFLGRMASTPLGPAVFARRFKAPVVPVFIVRAAQGGHRAIVKPPLYYEETGNEADGLYDLTVRTTKIIEDMIREYPDEWLWFQKRWNTPFTTTGTANRHHKAAVVGERAGEQA